MKFKVRDRVDLRFEYTCGNPTAATVLNRDLVDNLVKALVEESDVAN